MQENATGAAKFVHLDLGTEDILHIFTGYTVIRSTNYHMQHALGNFPSHLIGRTRRDLLRLLLLGSLATLVLLKIEHDAAFQHSHSHSQHSSATFSLPQDSVSLQGIFS